jgi:hypothetical protein
MVCFFEQTWCHLGSIPVMIFGPILVPSGKDSGMLFGIILVPSGMDSGTFLIPSGA